VAISGHRLSALRVGRSFQSEDVASAVRRLVQVEDVTNERFWRRLTNQPKCGHGAGVHCDNGRNAQVIIPR
jgi:hypothetical protein